MKKLVIVGNGMATGRLLDEIDKLGADQFDITVIGDEVHGSYNRIMLSPVLAGEAEADSIIQKPPHWYASKGIRFMAGAWAERISRQDKMVYLASGEHMVYDHLIIATGSKPARIAAKNQSLQHIYSFRTLDDVDAIGRSAVLGQQAIVVGGGLLGLEAAYGLACKGVQVTLVHRSEWLLNRQLDPQAGAHLRKVMETKGVRFELGTEVDQFVADVSSEEVAAAVLKNGKQLDCQLVVIATGISPNQFIGKAAGLVCGRAIQVDDTMLSSDGSISALGECCEHEGNTFGLVEPIWQQCKALAARLFAIESVVFSTEPVATKLKVSGVQVFSAGEHISTAAHRELVMSDPASGVYRKLLLQDGRITGIVLFGDTRDGQFYFELMQAQADVSAICDTLMLGQAFVDRAEILTPNQSALAA